MTEAQQAALAQADARAAVLAEIDAKYTDVSEVSVLSGKEITKFRADLYNKALNDYKLMLKAPTVAKLSAYLAKFIEYIKPPV